MSVTEKKKHGSGRASLGMMLVAIGVVYGDIGTSPMYVLKSILEGNGGMAGVSEELIVGALSLIIWTITLLTTIKYVLIAMKADNHGEGGIFSLYSLVKKCGKWLIVPAMVGGAALLADGILTPAVTVTTAIEGLRSIPVMDAFLGSGQTVVVTITLLILAALFMIQRAGTSTIGKAFGPVMLIWFSFLGITGVFNLIDMPIVLKAVNPMYAVKILFSPVNKVGFMILGSVFLAATGAEALYSDMGHVGKENIYCSWPFVKLCLILNYLGQGAWLLQNQGNEALMHIEAMNPFFQMLTPGMRPVAVLLGATAAIIASQALITGSFTLVSEAIHLDLMPHMQIKYPSETKGQLYISLVNNVIWVGCSLVVVYFQSSARMEAAYGLAITATMLMTTVLLFVYLKEIKKQGILAVVIGVVFGAIETVFFVSSLGKFLHGGYVAVLMAFVLFMIMLVWYRGTQLERMQNVDLPIDDYLDKLDALRKDKSIPKCAENLVFTTKLKNAEYVDRDILYSILDKDPKRADAYWFLNINVADDPYMAEYHVETYGTDYVFNVQLNLGFKVDQRVNLYLRQIVNDLVASGELPPQKRRHSIYDSSAVGNFKFAVIRKTLQSGTDISSWDERAISTKYAIRRLVGNQIKWYGLENSSLIVEYVPLFIGKRKMNNSLARLHELAKKPKE